MPLTFAHPAAILPFLRKSKYINFSAMVLGSMAPDFEYFLSGQPIGEISHTFIGFVAFNLPIVVPHIHDVLQYLTGQVLLPLQMVTPIVEQTKPSYEFQKDFSHNIGHEHTKQALEIAAAGGHNVLMTGPLGCGKILLVETFPSILPPLTKHQQLEVISLYQLAKGKLLNPQTAPYRQPHHSASSVAIIGGGPYPKPGEISLAHHGVLFLDEMAEFTKKTLDMLRQPLETGKVTISRAHSTVTYPASFILIGAMNPCPCGYLGSKSPLLHMYTKTSSSVS
ncbi:DUF4184 family protein [Peribacillus loiseleuriae]|uniref:DUF4184 family protein n=1 Tax=Peribacillus loiseleuriae TaxID=1679170 RepID=UPI00069DCD6B